MSTQLDLREVKDKKVKKVLEKKLEKDGMDVADKYDISKKEKLNVVTQTKHEEKDDTDPVFEGEVKIPEEYRTEGDSKKKDKQALRA